MNRFKLTYHFVIDLAAKLGHFFGDVKSGAFSDGWHGSLNVVDCSSEIVPVSYQFFQWRNWFFESKNSKDLPDTQFKTTMLLIRGPLRRVIVCQNRIYVEFKIPPHVRCSYPSIPWQGSSAGLAFDFDSASFPIAVASDPSGPGPPLEWL